MRAYLLALMIVSGLAAKSQTTGEVYFEKNAEVKKETAAEKNQIINILPGEVNKKEIQIHSKSELPLNFYVFDLEGSLIYQVALKAKEKKIITNLNKGTYMYNVFAKDESVEEGKLIVK